MCYYCRYLANQESTGTINKRYGDWRNSYRPVLRQSAPSTYSSCNRTLILRVIGICLFFLILNITIVVSHSSQSQLQKDQSSSNILLTNSKDSMSRNDESLSTTSSSSKISLSKAKRLTHEKRLIRDLLENYPTIYARPVRNVSETLTIQFGLTLTQLFDLGSNGQKMQTNTWKTFIWKDMNLVWDPAEYGGLATVCLPTDSIWTPDVVLYNYADERLKDAREISAVIQYTGDILYVPATMQFSICFLDITNFPYDIHQCSLTYRSWTYDHTKVLLTFKDNSPAIDMTSYLDSNEWKVEPLKANHTITNDSFSLLTYTMIIQRKGGLYGYILILPCLLLSAATMVVFWIPPESPAKMILTVSIFSGLFLLLLLLAESIPGGGGTPKIGYYYCVNMVVVSVTGVLATTVIHIYVRGDRRQSVPPTVRRLFIDTLAPIYCMMPKTNHSALLRLWSVRFKSGNDASSFALPEKIFLTPEYREEEFSKKLKLLKQRFDDFHRQQKHQQSMNDQHRMCNVTMNALAMNLRSIENDLKEVRDYLRHMNKKVENRDRSEKNASDWKQVALVLDRTFFFAYCLWFVISLIVMFPKTINISTNHWSIPNYTWSENSTITDTINTLPI